MGEAFALTAAMLWAISAFLFRAAGASISPILLNASKGTIAIGALAAWSALAGLPYSNLSPQQWFWLLLSGVVGIGIGDTAFFAALNRMGEQRSVLIAETAAPPLTVLLAFAWMQEELSAFGFLGIALTMAGVTLGITGGKARTQDGNIEFPTVPPPQEKDSPDDKVNPRSIQRATITAILLALVAAACQSFGAVISRWILSGSEMGPVESSLIRMLGGQVILVAALPFVLRRRTNNFAAMFRRRVVIYVGCATILGTILGIVCQQASLKFTSAGISQTLIATSVLIVLPISWILGQRPSMRQCFAAAIGLSGVAILCLLA